MPRDPRIDTVEALFLAWSSGDVDAPEQYFHPDAVLSDIVGGTYTGWPDIKAFFAHGLKRWPDLVLTPDEYWTNDKGVAVRWVMTATVNDPATFGPQYVGKKWSSDGLSHIDFEDGKVRLEVDYHDRAAPARSLGIEVPR